MNKAMYLKKIGVFDIESNNWIEFLLLGFFDGSQYKEFRSVKKFIDYLDNKIYDGFVLFAHNGGKFDDLFLLKELFRRDVVKKIIERQGRIIAIKIELSKANIVIQDSYALLPKSLDSLTKAFDVEHKKLSGEINWNRKHKATEPRLRKYLENDVLGTYEVLKTFFESDFVVTPKMTIASQALDTFRQSFLEATVTRFPLKHENYFRENWYAGGRVEVYKGKGNVFSYDVNSLFPFAMLHEMPQGEVKTTRTYQRGLIGFYRVVIRNTPDWYISPLLIKRKKNENVHENIYVNGGGEYFLSSATLDYLRKEFAIKFEVLEGFYFRSSFPLLQEYVNYFYDVKQSNANNAIGIIAKFFLNSLYGKFGQTRWKETVERWTPEMGRFVQFDNDFGLVLTLRESRSKFILPYLAAYITELARLHHFKLMNQDSGSMYYCDTDSFFTSHELKKGVSSKIGDLHFLGKFNGIFVAPKSYALKNQNTSIVHFKGYDSDSFTFDDLKERLEDNTVELKTEKERILSFRECLTRKKGITRERSPFLKMATTKKQVKTVYDKREIIPSSKFVFETKPLNWFPQL